MANLVNGLGGTAGFGDDSMARQDDGPSTLIDLSSIFTGGLNFDGTTYTSLWLNNNGNVTFGGGVVANGSASPIPVLTNRPMIAVYWADVDTRGGPLAVTPGGTSQGSNLVWWDIDPVTRTFTATWDDVGRYSAKTDLRNAFQLQIVAVGTSGDFDIHFRYETLEWTKGTSTGAGNARVGFTSGNGNDHHEFQQSFTASVSDLAGLSNVGEAGHFVFHIGEAPLFTTAADTVDFNNLTADQKASIAGGSSIYNGLGGGDTVFLPDPANYNQVVGKTKEGADIKLGWTDTAASTFRSQSVSGQETAIKAGQGDHFIKTGGGEDHVSIFGDGHNTITAGTGDVFIAIHTDTGAGTNTIFLDTGDARIDLFGAVVARGSGSQRIEAGITRIEHLAMIGGLGQVDIHAHADEDDPTVFAEISVDSANSPIVLHGVALLEKLSFSAGSTLTLAENALVTVYDDAESSEQGTIAVGKGAALQLFESDHFGVTLGTGSSTLVLHKGGEWFFNPTRDAGFEVGAIALGDQIVFKGYNPTNLPLSSATLGNYLLDDATFAPMLSIGGLGLMSITSIVGSELAENRAYFDVSLSADKKDTVLTLKAGNSVDAAVRGPEARSAHDVSGKGIRVGILSESFGTDLGAFLQDVDNKVLPSNVRILREGEQDFTALGYDHGRVMAGIIHAIAPAAELFFYAPAGATGQFGFADGINALRDAGCDIIVDGLSYSPIAEYFSSIDSAIDSAVRAGITYVTAAGDDRPIHTIYGHAANPNAITVAAMNALAVPSAEHPGGRYLPAATERFSSLGATDKPDITGVDGAQTSFRLNHGQNPGLGTAVAASSVAAVAALMMNANPLLMAQPGQVSRILETKAYLFGQRAEAGDGVVQADAAVANALLVNESFYEASANLPAGVSLSIAVDAISPAVPHPISAALSVPAGNAGSGATVLMLVTMDRGVIVTGLPSFTLNSGGVFRYDGEISSPSAGRLLFIYTVAAGEQAANLSIAGFAGAVDDSGGNDADFSALFALPTGLTINSPLKVSSVGKSGSESALAGDTIEITVNLNKGATLDSPGELPTLVLNNGGKATYDVASSAPSAGKLVFHYVVGAGERTSDLTITSVNLPTDTTLRDGGGNNADFTMALDRALGVQVGPAFVDAVLPDIDRTAVATGQTVELTIALSQGVVVDLSKGSPTLTLGNGAKAIYDAAASDPVKGTLVFDYTVGAADKATNLLVTGIALGGSTIRDSHGKDVDLAGAMNAPTALTINSPLTVDTLAASKAGSIRTGDTVRLSLTLETKLEVRDVMDGGFPTLTLNDGGTAFYNAAASTPDTGKLVFDYTVGASAQATTSLVITKFNQNGAILFDDKGNFADLSNALNVPTGLKVVVSSSATIEAVAATKPEGQSGSSAFVFTVRLDGAAATSETVAWAVTGSGANPASASDFSGGVLASGIVTFAAGETSKAVVVTVVGDTAVEASETFTVTLSTPSAGLVIGTATANGTIVNDDAAVSIAATAAAKAEGNGGATASTFTVTRSGDISASQTVSWAVSGSGTNPATAADFAGGLLPSGIVTFAAGETAKTVAVNVQGDTVAEADEGFVVTLSNPSVGLTIGSATAAGTIQNDDAVPPTAYDDAYVTLEGVAVVAAPATTGVLANDLGGPSLAASHQGGPSHGSLLFSSTGGFTYTPHVGYSGIDSFVYKASNGSGTENAEVTVYVVPVAAGAATTLDLLALTAEEQIAATYAAFFGRAVDSGGFGFWVGEFNRLLPVQGPAALFANIASSFGISDEAKALYPFLASPFNATDGQISAFLQSVYTNLFNRGSDAGGLAYWTGQIKQTLQAGQFVGSVLVNIMSGAQDTAAGKDITTLMGKVAVSLEYAHEQIAHQMNWLGNSDRLAATSLLQAVTSVPQTVLTGIRTAEDLVAAHP